MRQVGKVLIWTLIIVLVFVLCASIGAVNIQFREMFSALTKWVSSSGHFTLHESIFLNLRLPRILLSFVVGGSLALSGSLMQALFRNPIVEPGLIGTSSGAAFGAAVFIVFGAGFSTLAGNYGMPLTAFLGALLATSMVFSLSKVKGPHDIIKVLLVGVAINALFLSLIGIFSYIARDPQARSITFWSLGTLSGADWTNAGVVAVTLGLCLLFALRKAKDLNTLILGEDQAFYLGINPGRLKREVLIVNVLLVAISTAFVGVISFVGLIVPNAVRAVVGTDNRKIAMYSVVTGGIFLCLVDLVARIAVAPAELPIGIVTSIVGVPVFIWLIRRTSGFSE